MATENEELLVSIKADVASIRAGMKQAEDATKKFENTANDLKKSVNGFRQSFNVGINAVGGLDSAMDVLSGKSKLTAGSITSLLQIVAAASTPAGAAAVGFGLIATGILRVVENERKMKENRIDSYIKEVGKQAEAAAKGWDAYNKALETGTKRDADKARTLAAEGTAIDQRGKKFQTEIQSLEEQNTLKQDTIRLIEQEIAARRKMSEEKFGDPDAMDWSSGNSGGFVSSIFNKEINGTNIELKKRLDELRAQVETNKATIAGYETGLKDLGKTKADNTKNTEELTAAMRLEKDVIKEMTEILNDQAEAERKAYEEKQNRLDDARGKKIVTDELATPIETDNPIEAQLRESEIALADFRAEIMLAQETGGPFPLDWIEQAAELKQRIIENREELHAFNEEQKAQEKANREYEQSMEAIGTAAGDMFVSMADGSKDANEAMKDFMRAMMQEIMRMLIARVMGNAAVYGSEVAVQNSWAGPAAIGIGVAAAAAMSAAMMGMIPGFDEGGIVGGSTKRGDKQIIRANSGEEVLREDDPRHRKNFRGGRKTVNNFNSLVPYSPADIAKIIRKSRFDDALEDMFLTRDIETGN